jgi:cell filamentation protein
MSYKRPYETPERKTSKDPQYYEMGSDVLKNKIRITDPLKASEQETIGFIKAEVVFSKKLTKKIRFNSVYIQKIHQMALSHLYEFAGKYRDVKLSKAGHHFLPFPLIQMGMNYLDCFS